MRKKGAKRGTAAGRAHMHNGRENHEAGRGDDENVSREGHHILPMSNLSATSSRARVSVGVLEP